MVFKTEIVFVKIVMPLVLGIAFAYYFRSLQLLKIALIAEFILLLSAIFINSYYKTLKIWRLKTYVAFIYYLLFFLLGANICLLHTQFLKPDYFASKDNQCLKVWIAGEPQKNNDILRFEAIVTQDYFNGKANPASGKILIALKLDQLNPIKLSYGDDLLIVANYAPVEPPYNPAEFNFKAWLAIKNVYYQSFIRQNQLVKLGSRSGNPILKYALNVRQKQVNVFRSLIHNDEAFAVASTLILGYRADLSRETLAAYSRTGTIHALSVSGMHVGIVYMMLHWLLSFLDRKKLGRIFKAILICSLVWYYALISGFSPSVLRSAVMLSVFIIAKLLKRNSNSYNTLAFTAFCLLLFDPFLLFDVGFQLSFFAVFGLIYYYPKIYKRIYIENKLLSKIWSAVAIGLSAQLATLPLSVYYFHQFPVYFIVSNLFIMLPVSALMYGGLAILLLKVYFLAPAFEWLINFTNAGLKWIAGLPYAGITEIWLNRWQLVLLFIFIGALTIGLRYRKRQFILLSFTCLLFMQIITASKSLSASKQKDIVLFSLRKHYATAFITGNHAILLTDLSASDKNFQFFVKPALDQKQVTDITFITWEDDLQTSQFVKKHQQIIFQGKTILLLDETLNYKMPVQKLSFDYVWLHNNPKQKMEKVKQQINFSGLIVDASNKDYLISITEQQAKNLKVPALILKKHPAITLNLH
jgi:competence protein ComEC